MKIFAQILFAVSLFSLASLSADPQGCTTASCECVEGCECGCLAKKGCGCNTAECPCPKKTPPSDQN